MSFRDPDSALPATFARLDENELLRRLVEGTASETGEGFFRSLVEHLRDALGTMGAWVATLDESGAALTAVSMRMHDEWLDGFNYSVAGTPCEVALSERRAVHVPERLVELYHGKPSNRDYGAVSYLGVPVFDSAGNIIGQVAVLDNKPMPHEPRSMAIFQIFANRAGAELQRLQAERAAQEREAQLRLLVDNALDAIVDFDDGFKVALMNPAARRIFGYADAADAVSDVRDLMSQASRARLANCVKELAAPGAGQSLWIAGGLDALSRDGSRFQAEATLSHYRREHHHQFYAHPAQRRRTARSRATHRRPDARSPLLERRAQVAAELRAHRRLLGGAAARSARSGSSRGDGHHAAPLGRDRHRQRAVRSRRARQRQAQPAASRQAQLRGDSAQLDRERAVRARARRLHGRNSTP